MKRCIKLGVLLLIFVFLNFFITFNNTYEYEIETNVQAKYSDLNCLHKYGGEISEIETGDSHFLPWIANVTMTYPDEGIQWDAMHDRILFWLKSKTIHVSAKASNGATLHKINYYIYVPNGDRLCQGTIDDYNKAKSSAEFDIIFNKKSTPSNGLQLWMEVIDSENRQSDDKGTESFFYVDVDPPTLTVKNSTVTTESGAKYFNLQFNVADDLSGVDTAKVKFKVSKVDGYYSREEYDYNSGNISMKIPLSDAGEGKFNVHVEAYDKVGNSVTTEDGLFFDTNNPNAGLQLPGSNLTPTPGATTTTQSWTKTTATTTKSGYVPGKTSLTNFSIGDSQKIICDPDIQNFVKYAWKYALILAPILLIVMITVDFSKAIMSSNEDLLKKASSNAIKRTIATLLLLCLPLLLSTILDFFGLELCM